MNPFDLPGCTLIGYAKSPNVNKGNPVPLFEPSTPPDTVSINTLEGWNAAADKQNRKSFRAALGREPTSKTELDAWVDSLRTTYR